MKCAEKVSILSGWVIQGVAHPEFFCYVYNVDFIKKFNLFIEAPGFVVIQARVCYFYSMVDFLLIGFYNCINYNNIHPLLRSGKFGFGYNKVFDYEEDKSAPGGWFSNISDYCPPRWC